MREEVERDGIELQISSVYGRAQDIYARDPIFKDVAPVAPAGNIYTQTTKQVPGEPICNHLYYLQTFQKK